MRTLFAAVLILLVVFSAVASAETVRPGIEIGSRIFAHYAYDFSWYDANADARSQDNGANAFELSFAELSLRGWSSRSLAAEVRVEARRIRSYTIELENGETQRVYPDNWGDFEIIMKQAYIKGFIVPAFNVRAGLIGLPWIAEEEFAWRYRFVEDTLEMRAGTAWHQADIGLELLGDFPSGYGRYSAGVVNGESYRHQETNKYKAGFALVRVAPFAAMGAARGLTLSGAARYEVEDDPPGNDYDAVATFGGIVNFALPDNLSLGAEVMNEIQVISENLDLVRALYGSAFGTVRLVERLWAFGRFDLYEYNLAQEAGVGSRRTSQIDGEQLDSDDDGEYMALAGLAYEVAPKFRVALSYRARFWEQTYPDGSKAGSTIAPEHIGKASLEFGF